MTRTRRTVRLLISSTLLTALTAALLGGSWTAPATADGGRSGKGDVAWGLRTAANGFGDDRDNYAYDIAPGGSVADGLVVTNHSPSRLDLQVYAADGFTNSSGQLDLVTRDQVSTSVGAWVHAKRAKVSIAPGRSVDVPFSVHVPADAGPGDYVGGIVTSLSRPEQSGSITVDRRLALRIGLRVGGALRPQLSVEDVHVDLSGVGSIGTGSATVTYTVHNTGNAALAASQAVRISGPFGALQRRSGSVDDVGTLLPGDKQDVTAEVDGVRAGLRLRATVTVTPRLTDASGSTSELDPVTASSAAWAVPWLLLAALAVLLAATTVMLLLTRRRRRHAASRGDARVAEAVELALRERDLADISVHRAPGGDADQ